jgi:E3 ubiquitin-protein ligase UBR4
MPNRTKCILRPFQRCGCAKHCFVGHGSGLRDSSSYFLVKRCGHAHKVEPGPGQASQSQGRTQVLPASRCIAQSVYQEGYRAAPESLLAAYVYCRRVSAAEADGAAPTDGCGLGRVQLHATTTHFNLIHISCHAAARRADAALHTPKRWPVRDEPGGHSAKLVGGTTHCIAPGRGLV